MTNAPKPPFTAETGRAKVKAAEDAWNTTDPERVSLAYTPDSQWRDRESGQRYRATNGKKNGSAVTSDRAVI